MPAAGGMALANQLATTAPRDGSYLGMVRGTVVHEQVFGSPQVQFDARKFLWVANMNVDYDACAVGGGEPGARRSTTSTGSRLPSARRAPARNHSRFRRSIASSSA